MPGLLTLSAHFITFTFNLSIRYTMYRMSHVTWNSHKSIQQLWPAVSSWSVVQSAVRHYTRGSQTSIACVPLKCFMNFAPPPHKPEKIQIIRYDLKFS
jgi:hypothetical protein